MSTEVSLQGEKIRLAGKMPAVGSSLPDFKLVNKDLEDLTLGDFNHKRKLIYIVPSIDTPVCANSSKKFNELLAERSRDKVSCLVISADLPFANARFIGHEDGLSNLCFLSMMRSRQFAKDYGVLIETGPLAGIMARAVVVADEKNQIVYTELVSEVSSEPDYQKAMEALFASSD